MMNKPLLMGVTLCTAVALTPVVQAQTSNHPRIPSKAGSTMRLPDDPAIPPMADINTETTPREFVESFLLATMREDGGDIYDNYLHPIYRDRVSRDLFTSRMEEMNGVLGEIQRIGVAYLRADNPTDTLPERGYADYAIAYARDPRVAVRVQYEKLPDGFWRVTAYNVTSTAMDRFFQSRAAAMEDDDAAMDADGGEAEPVASDEDPGSPPQSR